MAAAYVEVDLMLRTRVSRAMVMYMGWPLGKQQKRALGLGKDHKSLPVVFLHVAADEDRALRRRADSRLRAGSLADMAKSHETRTDALVTLQLL